MAHFFKKRKKTSICRQSKVAANLAVVLKSIELYINQLFYSFVVKCDQITEISINPGVKSLQNPWLSLIIFDLCDHLPVRQCLVGTDNYDTQSGHYYLSNRFPISLTRFSCYEITFNPNCGILSQKFKANYKPLVMINRPNQVETFLQRYQFVHFIL